MSKNNLIQIGGELVNTVGDGIIADAAAVKDYAKNKTQQTINSELTALVENISRSVPSSGNVVKIESQQGNSVLVLKNEDGTEVSTIVGAADRYSGWEQGGDTRIPTIGLVKEKLTAIVDTALSTTSENAVQNKVVTTALTGKQATISDLSTIRSNAAAAAANTGDKAYNAADFSGLGRVNLQKNIVEVGGTNKNVLTQAMVNTANTIYHIQYDYDLNGQTITMPAGCVLEFEGGSVKNGTIVGTDTIIVDNSSFLNCSVGGTFVADKAYINATNMAKALEVFKTKNFVISEDITLAEGFDTSTLVSCEVEGNGHVINVPSLSVQNGNNDFCVKNATFNLSDTRIIVADAFAFGIVGTGNGNIKLENVTFNGLAGNVYLRKQNIVNVTECKIEGDSELSAGSRSGELLLYELQTINVLKSTFLNLRHGVHVLGGTSIEKVNSIDGNFFENCDGGICLQGGVSKNVKVVNNVIKDSATGGADLAAINIHHGDGLILIESNSIINAGGALIDLDDSANSLLPQDTNGHFVVRNNEGTTSSENGVFLYYIKDVIFEGNNFKGITYINTKNCLSCIVQNNNIQATTNLVYAVYSLAGEYDLSIINNAVEVENGSRIVDVNETVDGTTVNLTILKNQRGLYGADQTYITRNASATRVYNVNADINHYDKIDLQTLPANINKSLSTSAANIKISFDLSDAKGESAYTFFAVVGIYKSNSPYIFTIVKAKNTNPRLQTLYGNADSTMPRIFYEYNSDSLVLDVYVLVGAGNVCELQTILCNPGQYKVFNVRVTKGSTTTATAESKTQLYSSEYIETHTLSELMLCYSGALSYNLDNGFIVKHGSYPINYLGIRAGKLIGATTDRPANNTLTAGYQFYDTTLGKPIWWNGSAWVDATGVPAADSKKIVAITESDYQALATKDGNTLYLITP